MGYGMSNARIQLIGQDGVPMQPFSVQEVWCDPCATLDQRYHVTHTNGREETLAWWQVHVPALDDAQTLEFKTARAVKISDLERRFYEVKRELAELQKF